MGTARGAAGPGTRVLVLTFLPEFLGEEMLGDLPWLQLFAVPPRQRPRVTDGAMRARILQLAAEIEKEASRAGALLGLCRTPAVAAIAAGAAPRLEPPGGRGARPFLGLSALHHAGPRELRADPTRRLSLAEAAAACGLSASRFSHVFRLLMGVPFSQFCLRARLAQAAHQLAVTDLSVEDVAGAAGFVDDSHLHRQFRKHYLCTPTAYRRRFRPPSTLLR